MVARIGVMAPPPPPEGLKTLKDKCHVTAVEKYDTITIRSGGWTICEIDRATGEILLYGGLSAGDGFKLADGKTCVKTRSL